MFALQPRLWAQGDRPTVRTTAVEIVDSFDNYTPNPQNRFTDRNTLYVISKATVMKVGGKVGERWGIATK
ncbi:MAG: hypothetical protein LBQ79_10830 [Deltaproteobacteria bacterium]|nr:hypothetical protein [Deltaproteobacteria bacterium]